ncbi:cytochrome P450 [Fomitopsis betulina]|nr:cytochrome P450 [Fomitopsis betulina]
MPTLLIGILDALAFSFLLYAGRRLLCLRNHRCLPPGPPGWPVIGNIFDIPKSHEWQTFAEWGKTWGDIMSITLLGNPVVILNSSNAALKMLDKKSALSSDRPNLPVCGEVIGWDRTLALLHYNHVWRETRRLFLQTIGTRKSLDNLTGQLEFEGRRFVLHLLEAPEQVSQQVRRFSGASILHITYGYGVEGEDDELVQLVDRAVEEFSLASAPGAYYADILPILTQIPAWFPGASWKCTAFAWRRDLEAMCDIPFNFTECQMATGNSPLSFVSFNLESATDQEQKRVVKNAAASMYSAGADTTVSAICSFFLAMMCSPDAQTKAQAEIDRVIGSERLPSLSDREQLPYVRVLTWEVLRWQPIVPLGVPHRLTQDDIHNGYHIPKGTTVIANIWGMLRDPTRYSEPESFNPDRFLPLNGAEPECDPRHFVFGFGRRCVCPGGSQLAETSLFLICALTLAMFRISKPVVNGRVVEPSLEYTTGTISHPLPFACSIIPRSLKAAALNHSAQDGDR